MKGNWIFNAFFHRHPQYRRETVSYTLNPSVQFSLIIVEIRQAKISKKKKKNQFSSIRKMYELHQENACWKKKKP